MIRFHSDTQAERVGAVLGGGISYPDLTMSQSGDGTIRISTQRYAVDITPLGTCDPSLESVEVVGFPAEGAA